MSALKYLIVSPHPLKTVHLVITLEIRQWHAGLLEGSWALHLWHYRALQVSGETLGVASWELRAPQHPFMGSEHVQRACLHAGSGVSGTWLSGSWVSWRCASQACCLPGRLMLEMAQGISSSLFQHHTHLTHVLIIIKYICSVLRSHLHKLMIWNICIFLS